MDTKTYLSERSSGDKDITKIIAINWPKMYFILRAESLEWLN